MLVRISLGKLNLVELAAPQLRLCAVVLCVFIGSLVVFPWFQLGDQLAYRRFFEGVDGLSLGAAYDFYQDSLGTREPGFFLFVFSIAKYFQKDLVMSLLNAALAYHVFRWLQKHNVSGWLYPLFLINFYMLVLFFSAERLKLSLLCFIWAGGSTGILRPVLFGFSIITHVQVILLFAVAQVKQVMTASRSLAKLQVGTPFMYVAGAALMALAVLILLREHIESKLGYYTPAGGSVEVLAKPLVFSILAIYYSNGRKVEALLASLPLLAAAYFVGPERIVIFCYFVFLYYALPVRRGLNLGVLASTAYFAYHGVLFLDGIFRFGDGFAGGF